MPSVSGDVTSPETEEHTDVGFRWIDIFKPECIQWFLPARRNINCQQYLCCIHLETHDEEIA